MNKMDQTKTDLNIVDAPTEENKNYRRRGYGFIFFVMALSLLGVMTLNYFGIEFDYLVQFGLTFTGIFGLVWLILFIAGYARFGIDQESIQNFEAVADGLRDGVVVTDGSGGVVYSNAAYAKLTKLIKQAEDAYKSPPEIAFSGSSEISAELYNLANAAKNGLSHYAEVRLLSAGHGGVEKSVWVSIQISKIDSGDFIGGALWQIQDISGRSDHQELMINKLRQTIDYLEDAPVGFLSSSPDGEISFMNSTLARWLGGVNGNDFERKKMSQVVGDNGAMIINYQNKNFEPTENFNIDQTVMVDFIKKNGASFPAKILHRVKVEHGEVKKVSSFIMPATNLNDKMADVNADVLFSRFFNNAPLGMAALDENGVILSANPAFRELFDAQNVNDCLLTDMVAQSSSKSIERAVEQALVGKIEAVPIDFISGKDGQNSGQLFFNRVRTGEGTDANDVGNIQLVVYVYDTTQQRTLEAQFSQGQKMQAIGQLAGGIAHDFNNFLTAILGNCELLLSNIKPSDPSFADLMGIKNNANRSAGLVRQLLAFSRRQTLRPTLVILSDLISDMNLLFDQLKGNNVVINIYHGRDLGLVKVDYNQLEQVLMNLVVNASHAMPKGGEISIKTSNISANEVRELDRSEIDIEDYVVISVEDTGTGMVESVRRKIFEPFYTTKETGKGTGLGLSTAYGVIKQTGGYIYVESEEGVGTKFSIYLPRQYPSEEALKELSEQRNKSKEKLKDLSGKGTILLVDDEEGVRSFAVRALQARGYNMLEAEDGVEALALLEAYEGRIDLIISDVMMPEMDGPTMHKNLPEKYKQTTTIFMSGYAEEAYRDRIAEDAKVGFLSKPVGIKQLAETVKLYIDSCD